MADDLTRLTRAGDALAWALERLDALVDASSGGGVLQLLVDEARDLTGAPGVWALTWSGDLVAGRASFRSLAGAGVEGVPAPAEISRTIVGTAVREGRPVWTDDAGSDARFRNRESITSFTLRSVGCVPVGPRGVLYLLDPHEPGRFSREDRLRLAALCHIASSFLREASAGPPPREPAREPLPGMVGSDGAMAQVVGAVREFAPMPWPALILGETGTGKELVARAMHALSPRSGGPFLAVNCGGVPAELAESILFGHEPGSHSTAHKRHRGVVERADAGTLFLDEVGELPGQVQIKLLRLLQEGTYERLGGAEVLRFAGRVLAATNRDLEARVGVEFREDLFYRLAAGVIRLPPLRERRGDIPAIAEHLLERSLEELPEAPRLALSPEGVAALRTRDWPGNVRELDNTLKRAVARCLAARSPVVLPEHLGEDTRRPLPEEADGLDIDAAVDLFKRRKVQEALDAEGGNRTRAAERLGKTRQWLHKMLHRWKETEGPP